jgi:hypothetical protein
MKQIPSISKMVANYRRKMKKRNWKISLSKNMHKRREEILTDNEAEKFILSQNIGSHILINVKVF